MLNFSKCTEKLKPSSTLAVNERANALRAQNIDILNLAAGEIDFPTPEWIQEGAIQAMKQGMTRYTPVAGVRSLKEAIQKKFLRDNSLEYDLDNLIVGNGAKQLIFNCLMLTLNEGDEVLIPAPYWGSYASIVSLFGGKCNIIKTEAINNFKITPNHLKKALTDKTKWFLFNAPSNPAGCIYTREELKELATILYENYPVHVMCDDIYEHIIYDNQKFYNLVEVEPRLKPRALVINGVSKSYAMTGWRIGYAAGPKELIKKMSSLQSQSTSNACSVSQGAAITALNGPQGFLNEWCQVLQERRDIIVGGINKIKGLHCNKPEGAFYVYVDCKNFLGKKTPNQTLLATDEDVCLYLLDYAHVSVVPGSAFGLSPYFRASFACGKETLTEACHRIEKAVNQLES